MLAKGSEAAGPRVAGHVKVRNSEQGRRPSPPCPCLGPSLFLAEFGLSFPVAVAFNHDNLGVVGEAIDQRDRAGGVGKDGVPVLERQVRRHEQGAVFIAAADDLEEEVGEPVPRYGTHGGRWPPLRVPLPAPREGVAPRPTLRDARRPMVAASGPSPRTTRGRSTPSHVTGRTAADGRRFGSLSPHHERA